MIVMRMTMRMILANNDNDDHVDNEENHDNEENGENEEWKWLGSNDDYNDNPPACRGVSLEGVVLACTCSFVLLLRVFSSSESRSTLSP